MKLKKKKKIIKKQIYRGWNDYRLLRQIIKLSLKCDTEKEFNLKRKKKKKKKDIRELQINLILLFHENSLSHIQRQIITFISDSSNNFCMHKG